MLPTGSAGARISCVLWPSARSDMATSDMTRSDMIWLRKGWLFCSFGLALAQASGPQPKEKREAGDDTTRRNANPRAIQHADKDYCRADRECKRRIAIERHLQDHGRFRIDHRRAEHLPAFVEREPDIELGAAGCVVEPVLPKGMAARDARQHDEIVGRRRRRHLPFERATVPRIGAGMFAALQTHRDVVDEQKHADRKEETAD